MASSAVSLTASWSVCHLDWSRFGNILTLRVLLSCRLSGRSPFLQHCSPPCPPGSPPRSCPGAAASGRFRRGGAGRRGLRGGTGSDAAPRLRPCKYRGGAAPAAGTCPLRVASRRRGTGRRRHGLLDHLPPRGVSAGAEGCAGPSRGWDAAASPCGARPPPPVGLGVSDRGEAPRLGARRGRGAGAASRAHTAASRRGRAGCRGPRAAPWQGAGEREPPRAEAAGVRAAAVPWGAEGSALFAGWSSAPSTPRIPPTRPWRRRTWRNMWVRVRCVGAVAPRPSRLPASPRPGPGLVSGAARPTAVSGRAELKSSPDRLWGCFEEGHLPKWEVSSHKCVLFCFVFFPLQEILAEDGKMGGNTVCSGSIWKSRDKFFSLTLFLLCAFTAFSVLLLFSSKSLNNLAWFVFSYQPCLWSAIPVGQDFILIPFWKHFLLCLSAYIIVATAVFKTPYSFQWCGVSASYRSAVLRWLEEMSCLFYGWEEFVCLEQWIIR